MSDQERKGDMYVTRPEFETSIRGVNERVQVVADAVSDISHKLDRLGNKLIESVSAQGRPDWQFWGIIITIAGAFAFVGHENIKNTNRALEKIGDQQHAHVQAHGHVGASRDLLRIDRTVAHHTELLANNVNDKVRIARQDERLKALERQIYGPSCPGP